jgi:uncharacterized membrane-anchored protein
VARRPGRSRRAKARFDLNDNFRYLGAADARKVLEQLWGNPPDDSVLGMIVPKGRGVLDDTGWAVVVTYSDDGMCPTRKRRRSTTPRCCRT